MVAITEIMENGIAGQLGLTPGDRVVAIDGQPVRDFLDVLIAESREDVTLVVEKNDGHDVWELEIEKETADPFGFVLEHPEPTSCGNNCVFCFVHQMPKGMRRTLYVKDEDYRFSYLYGAYITLSNLAPDDIERIVRQNLSPLYVSVHAVDSAVRSRMLGREVPPIIPLIEQLVGSGIELHTQVVVCPGFNDAAILAETVETLAVYHPGIRSLALVPVGLTEHRRNLEPLQSVSEADAGSILDRVERWQQVFQEKCGSRFVFAADEFYLKAGREFPGLSQYEELSQLENGVGMVAHFRNQAAELLDEVEGRKYPVRFSVVTGQAFSGELQHFIDRLGDTVGCSGQVFSIENRLFGASVTVAGLVAGSDIEQQLKGRNPDSVLLVPDVMMRDGDHCFLDDLTPDQLSERLGRRVMIVPATPWGLLSTIEELSEEMMR